MQQRSVIGVVILAVLAIVVGVYFFGFGKPPQMGPDEEVFRAVDALYTAVTARNDKLLGECEKRLQGLKNAGKLPATAADYLDGVIATGRAGNWQAAAERLYDFMKNQQRQRARKAT